MMSEIGFEDLLDNELDDYAAENPQELFEHYKFVADKGQMILRVDKFLTMRIQNATRSKIQDAADANCILANNIPVKSNYKVKPGDVIQLMLTYPPREIEIRPENIPLDIVFEDNDLIIINKKPDMVVHPSFGHYSGTLVHALAYHVKDADIFKDSFDIRPGLVHRIDKNTSGLLVIAKNDNAKQKLSKQFFDKSADREYQALVWGGFEAPNGTVTGNIGRSLKDRKVMTTFVNGEFGKHAVTHYRVLEQFGYVTLIQCVLETGRTHQIRAHMKHIGHPIFNDDTYGGDQILKGTTYTKYKQFIQNCFKVCPRHALHAKSLGFIHPTTGKYIHFDSELPQDMQLLLEKWRVYVANREFVDLDE